MADLPIASSFSFWLKNPAFVSISLWAHLPAACPSICSTVLHLLQFSMGRSSYCIPFNLLKNPALWCQFLDQLLFQLLQFSLGRSPYLHSLQSAQESCIIVSISVWPDLPYIALTSICSRILHCFNFSMARASYYMLFNLLKNLALLQGLGFFICSKTFCLESLSMFY
jgi:hypothetical protein